MSTFRYRLRGVSPTSIDMLVEPGAGASAGLEARPPWATVTLADDAREPDLDEYMAGLGYVPDSTGPVVLVTVDHVMGAESIVLVDASAGAVDVTIPDITTRVGDELVVMKIDSSTNIVTVTPAGGDTIAGQATQTFTMRGQSLRILGDLTTTDWQVASSRRASDIIFDNAGTTIPGTTVQTAIGQIVNQDLTALETFTAGEALSVGDVVALNASSEVVRANSSIAGGNWRVVGVVQTAALIGAPVQVYTKFGASAETLFGAAPAAASNGQLVFLNSTSGQAALTPPTSNGNSIFTIGVLQGADGATATPTVIFRPQLIALRA
jgi:hypothetical protein